MRPLDPRLLRHAHAARGYVALTAGLGLLTAVAVVAQAYLIGHATAPVVTGAAALPDVIHLVWWLGAVLLVRAGLVAVQERYAHRAASRVIGELRAGVLERSVDLGPRWLAEHRGADVVTLLTRGLDSLEPYFVRYLPQLLLAVTVTPMVLVVIAGLDLVAAATIAVTIPLIPIFMVLVGRLTQRYAADRLVVMQRLGAQLLDLLAGLATLKAFGREHGPGARVRELGDAYRRTTMQTLRVAFLSGAILELLATLSVALVAVGVGLRLVYGELDLTTGLIVLILAPEVYLPLRQVGAHFHASADGVAAAQKAFAVLDRPRPAAGQVAAPDLRSTVVTLRGVAVRAPGRDVWAPARLDASIAPGRVLGLAGPSGVGKTTAVGVLLGLVPPDSGRVELARTGHADGTVPSPTPEPGPGPTPEPGPSPAPASRPGPASASAGLAVPGPAGVARDPAWTGASTLDLADVERSSWWAQIAWVPQRPLLLPGTVRENVLGTQSARDDGWAAWREMGRRGVAGTGAGRPRVGRLRVGWPGAGRPGPNRPSVPSAVQSEAGHTGARPSPAGEPHPDQAALERAAAATGLDEVLAGLPQGWDTVVGHGGVGLSVGQRQRLALTRALLQDRPLVVLDEPTAHLDAQSETVVLGTIRALARAGRSVLVVAHRASVLAVADTVVTVSSAPAEPIQDVGTVDDDARAGTPSHDARAGTPNHSPRDGEAGSVAGVADGLPARSDGAAGGPR